MNTFPFPRSLSLLLLATTLTVVGCGSNSQIPDTIADEGVMPAVQGSVFGGHAPLVGAHVYVLQANAGGIGSLATSLLGSGSTASPGGFTLYSNGVTSPTAPVTTDPNVPVGWEYVVTDGSGSFSLTNGYLCSGSQPVYIYAYGGAPTTPPTPPGANNPSIVNLATLGDCPTMGTFKGLISYVYLNEVSTVATAYAFQGFTSPLHNDAIHIGYGNASGSGEGLAGIRNAATNTTQLYDIAGSVAGHSANAKTYGYISPNVGPNTGSGTVPQTVLDTLANILAACVDSTGPTACSSLFSIATADGTPTGTQPTDTATAAINIARHPAGVGNSSFASNLFNIPTAVVPFSPSLNNAPPDFTVAIQYSSDQNSLFKGSRSIAVDAGGNFWLTTWATAPILGTTTYGTGVLAEFSAQGKMLLSSTNSSYAFGNVAIDSAGNAWAGTVNKSLGPVYEDGPSTSNVLTASGLSFTAAVSPVADNSTSSGDMYITHGPTCIFAPSVCGTTTDNNATLTEVLPTRASNGAGHIFTLPAAAFPTHAAIDSTGYEWITSDTPTYGNAITRVTKGGAALPPGNNFPIYNDPAGACTSFISPEQPAIDNSGNAWIPIYGLNAFGTGVFVVTPTGTCSFYNTESGASVAPYGAAVDGANNVWIANNRGGSSSPNYLYGGFGSLAELSATTGTNLSSTNFQPVNQSSGLATYTLRDPLNLAIDISGDIFVTNYTGSVDSVVEFIGLATPVYGPLGVAAGAGRIGTTP